MLYSNCRELYVTYCIYYINILVIWTKYKIMYMYSLLMDRINNIGFHILYTHTQNKQVELRLLSDWGVMYMYTVFVNAKDFVNLSI